MNWIENNLINQGQTQVEHRDMNLTLYSFERSRAKLSDKTKSILAPKYPDYLKCGCTINFAFLKNTWYDFSGGLLTLFLGLM